MARIKLLLPLGLLTLGLAASSSAATPKKVYGTVGPGFTIRLRSGILPTSPIVRTLKPGTYTFVVKDRARIHDFHLRGPGLSRMITTVGFVGTKMVTLTLKKGRYTYMCDPHSTTMHGSFTVA